MRWRLSYGISKCTTGFITTPPSAFLQADFLQRRRPRIRVDEHQRRLLHTWADAAGPDVIEDAREAGAVVEHLLDLMQHRFALLAIELARLFLVERLDIRVRAVR